jgi:ribonuclease P protein component
MCLSDEEPKADTRSARRSTIKGPGKLRFDTIYNEGRRFRGDFLTLICLPGSGLIGIATSKKIGSKPRRNLEKRRVRALVQENPLFPHLDRVVVASVKSQQTDYATLREDLAKINKELAQWAKGLESS